AVTGKAAFVRLFDETVSALRFSRAGEKTLQQVLSGLYSPDRDMRADSAASLTEGLKGRAHLLTYILNTLVLEHKSDSTLPQHADVMSPRNLANEIDGKVVDALMSAAEGAFPTVQRYYRLKARLLGLKQLKDYDRYAPISGDLPQVDWATARKQVQE